MEFTDQPYLSHVTRKPVFGGGWGLQPGKTQATEASKSRNFRYSATVVTILSRQRMTKALIRRHGCPG